VTHVTQARLITLLITAAMLAMLVGKILKPGGLSDGGFW
jgi:hypothetical protein